MDLHESWTVNAHRVVTELLAELASDPYGLFSPSVYETARLLALAPSLPGHAGRIEFVLAEQRPDGTWGGPDGYRLVPTLSAIEALLRTLHRAETPPRRDRVASATARGLVAIARTVNGGRAMSLPDTVAVEVIVPGLIADINRQLGPEPPAGLEEWRGHRFPMPGGAKPDLLHALRETVRQGSGLPAKLLHSLEIIGAPARGVPFAGPTEHGVGCSPAATATWLGAEVIRQGRHPCLRYLEAVQGPEGAVPVASPLDLFERSWILSTLASVGLDLPTHGELADSVHAALDESGAAGGVGLPPDADDTATALYALALLGRPREPYGLWDYRAGRHFHCFPAERTPSTTANAHVLQAFGAWLATRPANHARYAAALPGLIAWLCEQQRSDGSWQDKWHASPYYATACCATALAGYGGSAGRPAVRDAVDWVLLNQHGDGSWGRWGGSYEETAYAVRILLSTKVPRTGDAIARAAARGARLLLRWNPDTAHPPLWHDKDLYAPIRIVRAEGLAALQLAHADPAVAGLLAEPARDYEFEAS
ncbi:prenyltransferase/squalene oxidase repeat-containing protein [Amycolatopsis cihanbeyliensis]|uniref:Prenyltransferase/squalene oxidase-like repeat protein n=1 Tax=Amycolatopsis cihanbeyliensis TaxID=1128664 RepID=A0A542DS78_AMYCI|nr:prenyltransferase/squalene oxidase repeat-containing protein [Amycolatopsis cihanbeyliensis]TQJ05845.1 prenyltransferase/squalene oxidase-like repeat protein [Amycolatopsis cihanbeyliensis]